MKSVYFFRILEWGFYLFLFLISIYFAWEVLDKFNSQDRGIRHREEDVKEHPTIIFCNSTAIYGQDFNITYKTLNGMSLGQVKDSVLLKLDENLLELSGEKIFLKEVYTIFDGVCYNLTAKRNNINGKLTVLQLWSDAGPVPRVKFYFTSERNSYGITNHDWKDGKVFSIEAMNGDSKVVEMSVQTHIHLKCADESFYECAASKILKSKCSHECNISCTPITLTLDYPICQNVINYDDYEKCECNRYHAFYVLTNITTNNECPRLCATTQYIGTLIYDEKSYIDYNISFVQYKFATPLIVDVFEEYVLCDFVNLIGSVGGTLGLFIGFSFSNVIVWLIVNIQRFYNAVKYYFRIPNATITNYDDDDYKNGNRISANETMESPIAKIEMQLEQTQLKLAAMEMELSKISKHKRTGKEY